MQRSSVLCIFALLAAILLLSSCASAIGSYQPVAAFTANVTSGTAPLTVSFTDQSTYSPTQWAWNFGDGQNSNLQHPIHTYGSAGTYTVTLTVTN
ncbi:PKD domain-containing protein, partial [Methanomethylovorans sp.]|uniref:PKD domain-containing protein n=1 Tax=Methanomethylovorans sp. TaxID=2758717 RepID=UPI003FA56A81